MAKKIVTEKNPADSYVSAALGLAVVLLIGSVIYNIVANKPVTPIGTGAKIETVTEKTSPNPSPATPTKHTVLAGETLWSISEKYYQSGYNWIDIKTANQITNPDEIEIGQVLNIPNVKPIVVNQGQISAVNTDNKPKDTSYKIAYGDTLWSIAENEYQDGYRWVDIAKANNLTDPNLIHVGNVLKLP
jgi:peptidoglycan-N-acetylglucosamine deacetylase